MVEVRCYLSDEAQTLASGQALAEVLRPGMVVYLEGGLGAGKTTLSRGIMRGFGYQGHVKSPTYTLVEPYDVGDLQLYHFDLYRMVDPEELELIGGRDYFSSDAICLVEWPDKGHGALPAADLVIRLAAEGDGRSFAAVGVSASGQRAVTEWQQLVQGQFSCEWF